MLGYIQDIKVLKRSFVLLWEESLTALLCKQRVAKIGDTNGAENKCPITYPL